jgi:putative sterol carrier protein
MIQRRRHLDRSGDRRARHSVTDQRQIMTNESMEVFTSGWAEKLREEINRSADYRRHGATWDEPIALEMSLGGTAVPRTVLLDLHRGTCTSARCGNSDDADLVIRATVASWKKILAGRMDPIWGIMSGQLELIRGNLADLIPYALAAKALVDSAARIDARFPPEEGV